MRRAACLSILDALVLQQRYASSNSSGGVTASNQTQQRRIRRPKHRGQNQGANQGAASKARAVMDLVDDERELDVEQHFASAMSHLRAPTRASEGAQDEAELRELHRSNVGHNVDGHPDFPDQSVQRSLFDEGGVDVRPTSSSSSRRVRQGMPSWSSSSPKPSSDDILQLAGGSLRRHALQVETGRSPIGSSPSDPTLVEEPEDAYKDTPVELTDMLRERLTELKAEKLSEERNETFLPKRLLLTRRQPTASIRTASTDKDEQQTAPSNAAIELAKAASEYIGTVESSSSASSSAVHSNVSSGRARKPLADSAVSPDGSVLLLRTLQRASLCSRRDAIELIATGEVTVNNAVERNPFRRVLAQDDVKLKSMPHRLRFPPTRLWVYHKPANVIISRNDPAGRTLFTKHAQLLGVDHVVPVGSLPYRSHGVVLLTNDGELSRYLEHPSASVQQTFNLRVKPAIDPVLAHKLNTEGVRINGALYKHAEFLVNNGRRSRFHVSVKVRSEGIAVQDLMQHLGRYVQRGGRTSFGPFSLHGLPPGGIREVAVPTHFMSHVGASWKPFIERDWPFYRRQRVLKLKRLSRYRMLSSQEQQELDAFSYDELEDALAYSNTELAKEAEKISAQIASQPPVDDTPITVFTADSNVTDEQCGGLGDDEELAFVDDITQA